MLICYANIQNCAIRLIKNVRYPHYFLVNTWWFLRLFLFCCTIHVMIKMWRFCFLYCFLLRKMRPCFFSKQVKQILVISTGFISKPPALPHYMSHHAIQYNCNLISHIVCDDMWLSCLINVTTGFRAQVFLEIFTKMMWLQTEKATNKWRSFCFKITLYFLFHCFCLFS